MTGRLGDARKIARARGSGCGTMIGSACAILYIACNEYTRALPCLMRATRHVRLSDMYCRPTALACIVGQGEVPGYGFIGRQLKDELN